MEIAVVEEVPPDSEQKFQAEELPPAPATEQGGLEIVASPTQRVPRPFKTCTCDGGERCQVRDHAPPTEEEPHPCKRNAGDRKTCQPCRKGRNRKRKKAEEGALKDAPTPGAQTGKRGPIIAAAADTLTRLCEGRRDAMQHAFQSPHGMQRMYGDFSHGGEYMSHDADLAYCGIAAGGAEMRSAPVGHLADLRSDTVTTPTAAMREAMANAIVDDDVLGRDPTVALLEAEVARIMGKEAGLFVPSGTMSNLIGVLTHCEVRGSEYIVGSMAHIHIYEQGGTATLGGVHPRVIANLPDGTLDLAEIEAAVRPDDDHFPVTRLVCLENTHNKVGGKVLSAEYTDAVGVICKKHNLALHIDGARIFNAAVHLGVNPDRLVAAADSVSVCLSKGVGAPVGSVLVGAAPFIRKAKRLRKALGGAMRQSGVLAAAALIALGDVEHRIKTDHENMQVLAASLDGIPGLAVQWPVSTNICYVEVTSGLDPLKLYTGLLDKGIRTLGGARILRLVTHHQVKAEDIGPIVEAFREVCTSLLPAPPPSAEAVPMEATDGAVEEAADVVEPEPTEGAGEAGETAESAEGAHQQQAPADTPQAAAE